MFARILEFVPKVEKKEELIKVVKDEVLPILKKQFGFVDLLPFLPEARSEKVIVISLWSEKMDFERYEKQMMPKVEQILKPYMISPILVKPYMLETTICEHFAKAFAA
jgi:quinol monooxygenase YgiN